MNISRAISATGLPLVPCLPAVCRATHETGAAILRSDPGSGKSTLVPLALLEYFDRHNIDGKIIMLEPRRAAAIGIASRLADLLGEKIGERAGYSVRLERRVSGRTRIEVLTEGLLVRRMQDTQALFDGSARAITLIFDEFHERSIHTDLALAFALDLRRMGADIRLLIMSATMDAVRAASFIDSAPIIECPGRPFPVTVHYRPLPRKASLDRECSAALADILRDEINKTAGPDALGDILVFLPGKKEIAVCAAYLAEQGFGRNFEIRALHGSLPLDEQRSIITGGEPGERDVRLRRLVLSTNVAETSLTIPGITLVIDSGFARIQRFHVPSGMNRLSLEPVSAGSAEQRAGRAGRLGPGRCVRLWAEGEARPKEIVPEILRIDLSALALECLLWGLKRAGDLSWLDKPPEAAWNQALGLLCELGAVDGDFRPTALGGKMARLGLEPRLARLCIAGAEAGQAALACAAAALLSERDSSGISGDDPDFFRRLQALRNGGGKPWARRVLRNAGDLIKRMGLAVPPVWTVEDESNIGEILAAAFPDRIAKKRDIDSVREGEGVFRFTSGREGRIALPLGNAGWLCAMEADAGERTGSIRLAISLSEEAALAVLERQSHTEKTVEWKGLVPRLVETKTAGRIVLGEKHRPCCREELIPALVPMLYRAGLAVLPWEAGRGAARRFLERIRFYAARRGADMDWTDACLAGEAAEWLGPFMWDGAESGRGVIISSGGLISALAGRLGWDSKREIDRLVPEEFTLPSGRNRAIDYSSGEPVLRLRLQEAFGICGKCEILSVPLVFQLLSPADRPIQITRDLAGFWSGSYAEVRREMRGRYPKHQWPENPALACPARQ